MLTSTLNWNIGDQVTGSFITTSSLYPRSIAIVNALQFGEVAEILQTLGNKLNKYIVSTRKYFENDWRNFLRSFENDLDSYS